MRFVEIEMRCGIYIKIINDLKVTGCRGVDSLALRTNYRRIQRGIADSAAGQTWAMLGGREGDG